MDNVTHTAQLQFLLRKLRNPDHPRAATDFTRFVYFQCYPNIKKRLCHPFRELFRAGTINPANLRSRWTDTGITSRLDPEVLRHGDKWISTMWRGCLNTQPAFEKRNGEHYLINNANSAADLHKLICHVFRLLSDELDIVRLARDVHRTPELATNTYLRAVKDALYGVDFYMEFFDGLVRSPCFWVHLAHPVLQEWVRGQQIRLEVYTFSP